VNQTDAFHVPCEWLFATRVRLSGVHTSEFITNSGLNQSWQRTFTLSVGITLNLI